MTRDKGGSTGMTRTKPRKYQNPNNNLFRMKKEEVVEILLVK